MRNDVMALSQGARPEPMHVQLVSGTYFSTLGVDALGAASLRIETTASKAEPGSRCQLFLVEEGLRAIPMS